jgi:hypothetical protein
MRIIVLIFACALVWGAPTIQTVTTGAELQTAINTAAAADSGPQIIVLTAGNNFDTAGGFTLPARSGSYTGWITLRSSRISELPGKTRVVPADSAKMATLRVTAGGYAPVMYTSGHPSAYWRLEGLEFTLSTTSLSNQGWLVGIGAGTDAGETEPSLVSHHFVVDRCYIHGIAFDNGPRDGIRVNGDDVEVLNSYISEIKRDDTETHGILGYSLNGPVLIRNTFVGGASIGSLIGGANASNVSIQPSNVQFLGNHYQGTPTHRALRFVGAPQGTAAPSGAGVAQTYWKTDTSEFYVYGSAAWRLVATGITGNVCMDGDFWSDTSGPTHYICSGGVWTSTGADRTITGGTPPFTAFASKNRFELKKVTGALVEGNLIENCFSPTTGQQTCSAFLLNWVTDQDQPWSTLRNITIRNNLIRRTGQMYVEGVIDSPRRGDFLQRWPRENMAENNLVQDGNNPGILQAINRLSYYNVPPVTTGLGGVGVNGFDGSRFIHNTVINPLASENFWPNSFVYGEAGTAAGRNMSDNIFEVGGLSNAAYWLDHAGCSGFDEHWPKHNLKNNVLVHLGHQLDSSVPGWFDFADCRTWATSWKRSGAGVSNPIYSASIAAGVLTIRFGTGPDDYWKGHGLLQGTKVKLSGWTPAGLNGTYTIPRLWCGSGSTITAQSYQPTLCLPTAETGAVTPGTIEASIDYTDYAALNFRLAATSAYKGWATDGSDPGANQDMVEWATATAASGTDNPYLDFRVRSITPTSDGAVFRYTAYSTAACTWRASSTRAFSDNLGSWGSETRIGRDGSITVTGLTSNTGYWYRMTCDSKIRDGEVVTTH